VAILDPGVPVFIRSRCVAFLLLTFLPVYSYTPLYPIRQVADNVRRKHPYTPHPIFVLLALTQALLAGLYVLRALLRDVWVFPFRVRAVCYLYFGLYVLTPPTQPHTPTPHPAAVLAPALLALLAPLGALVILFVFLPVARWVPFGELLGF
jgi:hypothetical protein